jgi:hypothetical protein
MMMMMMNNSGIGGNPFKYTPMGQLDASKTTKMPVEDKKITPDFMEKELMMLQSKISGLEKKLTTGMPEAPLKSNRSNYSGNESNRYQRSSERPNIPDSTNNH